MSEPNKRKWIRPALEVLAVLVILLEAGQILEMKNQQKQIEDGYKLKTEEGFSQLLSQTDFTEYENLLKQLSTTKEDNAHVLPLLKRAEVLSKETCAQLVELYDIQSPVSSYSIWGTTSQTSQDTGAFAMKLNQARMFPILYWMEQKNNLEHRSLQPEDRQLFQAVAQNIHDLNTQINGFQQINAQGLPEQMPQLEQNVVHKIEQNAEARQKLVYAYKTRYISTP